MKIVACNSNRPLAEAVASALGLPLTSASIRRFADRDHANIVSWNEYDRGGHWSAHDAPDLLLAGLRQFFARFQ